MGAVGSLVLARLASAWLPGVEPGHPLTYAGAALFLAAIGLIAGWVPAARAARVGPLRALRQQ